jgi:uncharacterized protein YutE (UPF0331/DUF86 family)
MVRSDIIQSRIVALGEYLDLLRARRDRPLVDLLADVREYHATLYELQMACQIVIDISSHILLADFARRVDRYRDVILGLGSEGVLPTEFAQRISGVAGFRNILIHEYLIVDPQRVYQMLQTGLDDLSQFGEYISVYLRQTGSTEDQP